MRSFLIIILSLLFTFPAIAAETITIVADRWCPFNCGPKDERPGFMIEIAKQAFARHGIEVEYSTLPWSRAIEETRQGKHTAIVGSSHNDAPDFVFPQISQGKVNNKFYVKKGDGWWFKNIKSLSRVSLGAIADYAYNDELDAYIQKYKSDPKRVQLVSGENALDSNVKKLMAGRISALIESQHVVDYYLMQQSLPGALSDAGDLPPTQDDNVYLAFSPKNPNARRYADIVSEEVKEMRKSGKLQQILTNYGVRDWQ